MAAVILASLLLCSVPSFAVTQNNIKTVKVGVAEFGRLMMLDNINQPEDGYAYEYLQTIAPYAGWNIEYVYGGSFTDNLNNLLSGKIDLYFDVSYSEDRADIMAFPDKPMGTEKYYLYSLSGNTDIVIGDPSSADGKTIGVTAGTVQIAMLKTWCSEKNITATIKEFEVISDKEAALLSGDIDLDLEIHMLSDSRFSAFEEIGSSDYYLVANINRKDLVDDINRAVDRLEGTNSHFISDLDRKYFSDTSVSRTLAAEEKEWVKEHDKLRVGYMNNYLPFSTVEKDGGVSGIIADVVPLMLKNIGVEDEITVEYTSFDDNEAMYQALRSGEIDTVFPAYGGTLYAYTKGALFTSGVTQITVDLAYKDEYSSDVTNKIAVNRFNQLQEYYTEHHYPDAEILYFDNIDGCLDAVASGKADSTLLNGFRTRALLSGTKYGVLHASQVPGAIDLCFAVRNDNVELLSLLNRSINNLDQATVDAFTYGYVNAMNTYSINEFVHDNLLLVILIVAALLAAVTVIVIIKMRSRETEKELAERIELEKQTERVKSVISAMAEDFDYISSYDMGSDKITRYAATEKFYEVESTIDHNLTDMERLHAMFRKIVHPDEWERFSKLIARENIENELKKNPVYKFETLTVSPEGKEEYYRFKFAAMPDEPNLRIMGLLNIDENVRREQELAVVNEKAKRENIEQNLKIIEGLASEYASVYYIDLETDGLTPYAMNKDTESAFGVIFRSGITYSDAFRMYVNKRILPEDREMMLKAGSVGNIMDELTDRKTFITTFRNVDDHYCEMKFVKVGNETGIPAAVALGFADKDSELRAKEEESKVLQRNIDIIEVLASEYTSVYYIDLTTDELDPYTMSGETESRFGQIFRSGIKYSDAYKMYVDKLVFIDDQAMMLKAGSIYTILKELRNKKTYLTTYRNESGSWCEMKFVKVGNDRNPTAVALGFADKDEEIRNEVARKEKAERDMAVITGLSDDFGCVVYMGYEDFNEVHYRFDPVFEKHIPGWSKITKFNERLDTLINTLIHPDDRKMFYNSTRPDVVKAALHDSNAYFVNFRLLVDGEIIYYQAKFAKDPRHANTHVIAGFHNVDAETKREMEALEKATIASKAKTDFLFNMSHDIRTPMNAIIGFTNMAIKHKDEPEKLTEYLEKTQASGNLLLTLINSILDMSRIESGKAHLEEQKGDVMLSFVDIESTMQELARTKDITLDMKVENVTDRYVLCDFGRCNRVFINLISNAIKYTPAGGWVKVRGTQVGKAENGCGLYQYTVEDNGIGMSEEFQKNAFDEFTREKNSTVSGIQGTGLGLAVCKTFVTLMSGTIVCESEQGVGSKFTVTIPLKLQSGREYQDPVSRETVDLNVGEKKISLEGRLALLVEDNEMNRDIARDILEEEGLAIEEAIDGSEAVEMLREKGPDYYDFILMDIQMPVMNGYEATKEIRKMYPNMNIPIIALSANAFEEDRKASLEAGMDAHVAKPIVIRELLDTIMGLV